MTLESVTTSHPNPGKEDYRMETEYVRRGDDYDDKTQYPKPVHVTQEYTRENGSYQSIPEVAGKFMNLKNEYKKEGFLEFFVYNIYEPKTYPVAIRKVDSTNQNTVLSDAEFDLYGPYSAAEVSTITDKKQESKKANAQPIKADKNGIASIGNLVSGYYYLYETKAPAGYIMGNSPITIVVNSANEDKPEGPVTVSALPDASFTVDAPNEQNGNCYTFSIPNTPGVELPSTGGSSTAVYTAAGLSLMSVALWMLLRRRKEQQN